MKIRKLLKYSSMKLGLFMYVSIWIITILGSCFIPLNPYEHESMLADLPPSSSYLSIPDELEAKHVATIVNGVSFGAALMDDQKVVLWGEDASLSTAKEIENVKSIAAGAKHIILADALGTIYEYGEVPYAQTALDRDTIAFLKKDGIREVYASDSYSACLSNSGYLFYWGSTASLDLTAVPEEHQGHIQKAALNPYHILYLLDDGTLQILGRKDQVSAIPTEYKNGSKNVIDFAITYENVMVIDEDHKIATWGETKYDIPVKEQPKGCISDRHNFYISYTDKDVYDVDNHAFYQQTDAIFANYFQTYRVQEERILTSGHAGFLFGSDSYGRDILARILHGGYISLLIGLPACLISLFLSIIIGMCAGYFKGRIDRLFLLLSECISSIPFLPIVITFSAFLLDDMEGYTRIMMVMVLYGFLSWVPLARLIRTKVLTEKEKDYITYEKMIGASSFRILWKHIFPSTFGMIAADITLLYASTLLMEASLSFLGFGVPPLYPTWGNMIAFESIQTLGNDWWQWLFPSLCIFFTILSVHLMAEALRKNIDSKE